MNFWVRTSVLGRGQFEHGTDTESILQEKGAARRAVFHPWEVIGKGRLAFVYPLELSRGN